MLLVKMTILKDSQTVLHTSESHPCSSSILGFGKELVNGRDQDSFWLQDILIQQLFYKLTMSQALNICWIFFLLSAL